MLHLEGKALDWHHFFCQHQGLLQHMTWEIYFNDLQDHFGFYDYLDMMEELVSLKQQGTVDQYHNMFVSLLNQLYLPKPYALSIFISNLKGEICQYLKLFKPHTLVEGLN